MGLCGLKGGSGCPAGRCSPLGNRPAKPSLTNYLRLLPWVGHGRCDGLVKKTQVGVSHCPIARHRPQNAVTDFNMCPNSNVRFESAAASAATATPTTR